MPPTFIFKKIQHKITHQQSSTDFLITFCAAELWQSELLVLSGEGMKLKKVYKKVAVVGTADEECYLSP